MYGQPVIGLDELDFSAISGQSTIVGALNTIIGAALQANPQAAALAARQRALQTQQAAQQMQVARLFDPHAAGVMPSELGPRLRKVLPIPQASVGAGVAGVFQIETQELFRPERLIIDSNIADDFVLQQAQIGTKSQFAAPGEVPANVFSPTAVDAMIHWDTINLGQKLILVALNTSAAPLVFRGMLIGTSILGG